jgi:hypothetical protein
VIVVEPIVHNPDLDALAAELIPSTGDTIRSNHRHVVSRVRVLGSGLQFARCIISEPCPSRWANSMRTAGVFILNIEPETASSPTRLSIALSGAVPDHPNGLRCARASDEPRFLAGEQTITLPPGDTC